MDRYSKFIFTVIAVALVFIAAKIWEPKEAHSGFLSGAPTFGEWQDLRKIKTGEERKKAYIDLRRSLPMVYVYHLKAGNVSID